MKLPGRRRLQDAETRQDDKTRRCPQCETPVSLRATTCAVCGYDFVAASRAEQRIRAEQQEEAAQRPVRAIAIGVTAAIVFLLIAALYIRNRSEAIAALTPTITPTPTPSPLPSLTPTPTPSPPFTLTPLPPKEYHVQPGDTIFYIADLFQIDYNDLLAFNGLTTDSILSVGQTILVPPATPTPTPSPTPLENTPVISPTPSEIIHIVQTGETLIAIAQKYGVSESVILSANHIENPDVIRAGDRLIIPLGPVTTPITNATAATVLPNYGPVTLLQPLDGSRIVGNDKPVLLQWLSAGILGKEETYRVTVEQVDGDIRYGPIYIKATGLHVPIDRFPPAEDTHRAFRWTVTLMLQTGVGTDGTPLYNVISPPAFRTFQWMPAPPLPTLTPTP